MRAPPEDLRPQDRLHKIVEDGMCIGCGLCQAVAGRQKVKAVKVTSGHIRPVAGPDLEHKDVDLIYDVCPGTRVDGLPERLMDGSTRMDRVWGAHRAIVLAHAGDPDIRFEGSTGGVLTALGTYLLETGQVEFIFHTRTSKTNPTFGESTLSFTSGDVWEAAGSRYGPTATLVDINDVLDRGEAFAFIGKPCDIGALRNYARHDARVDDLVQYWLTLVCGGYMPPAAMNSFLARYDVAPDDVTAFRYRGRGCPGPTRFETRQGLVKELRYTDFWGEDESGWSLPFRCKVCPDGIGESADIAVSDTWPGGSPDPKTEDQDLGANAMIARTPNGQELLNAAIRDGALGVDDPELTPEQMTDFQPHQMKKKYAVWARFEGLRAEGRTAPITNRLRLKQLADEMGDEFNTEQTDGTRQRVRDGKTTEPTPQPAEQI
ncbi:MAG: Coenzyme F420 hydrogenase/dehydrogenase, beta subunit C-terminal domain [Pseudomonadota bacterium]